MRGKLLAVCISEKKGTGKTPIEIGRLVPDFGLEGDAHGGNWHRQVSLLSAEKIEEFNLKGGSVVDGDFGENLIVQGIELRELPVGTQIKIGDSLLEITQIGKECHTRCNIYYSVGDCIMPREGVFAKVLSGCEIKAGDEVVVLN